MTDTRARSRTGPVLLGVAVTLVIVAGFAALALYLAPRVLPNLQTAVAETDTELAVTESAVRGSLVVPAGWTSYRAWGDDDVVVVRTPDARMEVTVAAAALPTDAAFARAAEAVASIPQPATERLASGLQAVHGAADDVLVAAVGDGTTAASVTLVARVPADLVAEYRRAFAVLVESVRVVA